MSDILRILYVDDEAETAQQMKDLYDGLTMSGYQIEVDIVTDFDQAIGELRKTHYDIVILDVYQGKPAPENKDLKGEQVLEQIKQTTPVAVILYTALPAQVKHLESPMVKVLSKAEDDLEVAIGALIDTGIPLVKKRLMDHFTKELTKYYWDFAEKQPELLATVKDDHLFEHLVTRRLASTLDENGATKMFGGSVGGKKVHPWRMFIIPPSSILPERMGQVIQLGDSYWIVLTPSCDLEQKKASYVLLAFCSKLDDHEVGGKLAKQYKDETDPVRKGNKKASLDQFLKSNMNDRFFFLPSIDIMDLPALVIDLQQISSVVFSEVQEKYKVVAELDTPYAQDLQAKFTRYNNRPGTPDIETAELIDNI